MSAEHTEHSGKMLFGALAVAEGYCTQAQIDECLAAQKTLKEMGLAQRIGEIMVKKGVLTREQAGAIAAKLQAKPILAGFEILEKVGQGGMGAVFRARQISMDRIVALKLLSRKHAQDPTYKERFLREARISARLSHPNLLTGIDVGEAGGYMYYAMEFVEGKTLRQILKERGKPLPLEECLAYIRQTAEGLRYAHNRQLVHRDIKPDNIMVDQLGQAKLCDLGLAQNRALDDTQAGLTRSGQTVGTPHYISPEQARGEDGIDQRTDLYGLGATLYHLLGGRPVFEGSNGTAVMIQHLNDCAPALNEVNPQIPPAYAAILSMMLAKQPLDRYPDVSAFLNDLEAIDQGQLPPLAAAFHAPSSCRLPSGWPGAARRRLALNAGTTGPRAPIGSLGTTGPRKAVGVRPTTGPLSPISDPSTGPLPTVHSTRGREPRELRKASRSTPGGFSASAAAIGGLLLGGTLLLLLLSRTDTGTAPVARKPPAGSSTRGPLPAHPPPTSNPPRSPLALPSTAASDSSATPSVPAPTGTPPLAAPVPAPKPQDPDTASPATAPPVSPVPPVPPTPTAPAPPSGASPPVSQSPTPPSPPAIQVLQPSDPGSPSQAPGKPEPLPGEQGRSLEVLRARWLEELLKRTSHLELRQAHSEMTVLSAQPEFAALKPFSAGELELLERAGAFETQALASLGRNREAFDLPRDLAEGLRQKSGRLAGYDPERGLELNVKGASLYLKGSQVPLERILGAAEAAARRSPDCAYFCLARGALDEASKIAAGLPAEQRQSMEERLNLARNGAREIAARAAGRHLGDLRQRKAWKELAEALKAFQTEHGESQWAREEAGELARWGEELAQALESQNPWRKRFKAKKVSQLKDGFLELIYDFSTPEQAQDWTCEHGALAVAGGYLRVPQGGGEWSQARLAAPLEELSALEAIGKTEASAPRLGVYILLPQTPDATQAPRCMLRIYNKKPHLELWDGPTLQQQFPPNCNAIGDSVEDWQVDLKFQAQTVDKALAWQVNDKPVGKVELPARCRGGSLALISVNGGHCWRYLRVVFKPEAKWAQQKAAESSGK